MSDWQQMIRTICARMTREKAAELLQCSKKTIDCYLGKHPPKEPYTSLGDRIREAYKSLMQ